MQGAAGPEYGVEQFLADSGVEACAGFLDAAEADLPLDGDQSADLVLGEVGDSADDFFNDACLTQATGTAERANAFAESNERAAEFGLEDDDQREREEGQEVVVEKVEAFEHRTLGKNENDGREQEDAEANAFDDAGAACAAEKAADEVDDDPDERQLGRDDPPRVALHAVDDLPEKVQSHDSSQARSIVGRQRVGNFTILSVSSDVELLRTSNAVIGSQ